MDRLPKTVLEEEEYVETLEKIIERDFFPDLQTLKCHAAQMDGNIRNVTITATPRTSEYLTRSNKIRRIASEKRVVSSWDEPTPDRRPLEESFDDTLRTVSPEEETKTKEFTAADLTLNQFVATHTSEDNDSFNSLQEKAIEDHQRKYHWAFDNDKDNSKLLLLKDGTWMSKERRQLMDEACATKEGPEDNRVNGPDTWKYRAQNPLLFPPDLKNTRQICGLPAQSNETTLLLENGKNTVTSLNSRIGAVVKPKKMTVYANSRFSAPDELETHPNGTASSVTGSTSTKDLGLVEMTPLIAPGVDASPLMTWGDIEATPMILDSKISAEKLLAGPSFEMKETSQRERIADKLEAQARARKSKSKRRPTPLRGTHGAIPLSSIRRNLAQNHTPSQRLMGRLSSIRSTSRGISNTPFGSDLQLRASYSTPLLPPHRPQKPSTGVDSSFRSTRK